MKQYLDLLQNILDNGVEKEKARPFLPKTMGISKSDISMDLTKGFPLLTTKKMYWKGIVHELLWFLKGNTNIKYLIDNKVNIWNPDAYRWYLKHRELGVKIYNSITTEGNRNTKNNDYNEPYSLERFVEIIKNDEDCHTFSTLSDNYDEIGDLGKIYGYQWRNQNGVDQVKDVIDGLKSNPNRRYHIIDGWNKSDFIDMALPPCHLLYQFISRPMSATEREDYYALVNEYDNNERMEMNPNCTDEEVHVLMDEEDVPRFFLDLNMYQRSVDTFLGVGFNLASMSLLLMIIAETSNMIAGVANWIGGDTHIYLPHIPMIKEQITRTPKKLPQMIINKKLNNLIDIENLNINDFELVNYQSHSAIKGELFVGLPDKS